MLDAKARASSQLMTNLPQRWFSCQPANLSHTLSDEIGTGVTVLVFMFIPVQSWEHFRHPADGH